MLELAALALIDGSVPGRDDTGGHGLRKREGAANGNDPVADLGSIGVAHFHGGQRFAGVDFDDGKIGVLIDTDHFGRTGLNVAAVGVGGEADEDLIRLVDDVIVGEDVSPGIDDKAGAERFALLATLIGIPPCPPKKRLKKS